MSNAISPDDPALRVRFNQLYREFFDRAERNAAGRSATTFLESGESLDPAPIADVVESFCAVEMYLPDYIAKALPMIRKNKGWAWFHANWGYEESRHSLALGDWLLRSGMRTDEQMADLEDMVFQQEWEPPQDSAHGMLIYANGAGVGDLAALPQPARACPGPRRPALTTLLQFIAVDEKAHHAFYRSIVQVFMEIDRKETLEQLRRVLLGFRMPAVHLLAESQKRVQTIKDLNIFDEDMFLHDVYQPILEVLGIKASDLRRTKIPVR